jgi:hypothetical protein
MSTAEIIAELPRLSAAELAQVDAKLRELLAPGRASVQDGAAARTKPIAAAAAGAAPRIHTPRLARPEQSKDFIKQVVEPDAGV